MIEHKYTKIGTTEYVSEISPTNYAKCRGCRNTIDRGELRLKKIILNHRYGKINLFYCNECRSKILEKVRKMGNEFSEIDKNELAEPKTRE